MALTRDRDRDGHARLRRGGGASRRGGPGVLMIISDDPGPATRVTQPEVRGHEVSNQQFADKR